jgi:hypothetical protein
LGPLYNILEQFIVSFIEPRCKAQFRTHSIAAISNLLQHPAPKGQTKNAEGRSRPRRYLIDK